MHTFTQAAHPLYIMLFCIAFSNLPLCVRLLAKPGFNCFNHGFHGLFFVFPIADKLDLISRFHACSKDTQYTFRICCGVIVIHEFYLALVSACYVTEHPCRSEMQSRRICYCNFLSDHNVFSPFLSVIRSGRSDCFHLSLSDCCSGFHPVFYCSALIFQV